jgi:hypothetical protein
MPRPYIRLTEAIIAGTADAVAFQLTLSARAHRRIRQRAEAATATRLRAVSVRLGAADEGRRRRGSTRHRGVDVTGVPPILRPASGVDECGDDFTALSYRADIFLNAGKWQPAAEAAHKVGGEMNASEGFVEAFALFERGQIGDALAAFLGAALHYPRAARMLVGLRTPAPKSSEEARDHNTGVGKLRSLHAYLKTQSRRPRKFFSSVARDPRVVQLLDESIAAVRRWHEDRSGDRSAFDRMKLIQSREFARSEANKLRDLVVPTHDHPRSVQ